jgi:hypothetical protein
VCHAEELERLEGGHHPLVRRGSASFNATTLATLSDHGVDLHPKLIRDLHRILTRPV